MSRRTFFAALLAPLMAVAFPESAKAARCRAILYKASLCAVDRKPKPVFWHRGEWWYMSRMSDAEDWDFPSGTEVLSGCLLIGPINWVFGADVPTGSL